MSDAAAAHALCGGASDVAAFGGADRRLAAHVGYGTVRAGAGV